MSAKYSNPIVSSEAQHEELSTNKMICALSAIAFEMKKFHNGTPISCHNFGESQELCEKLSVCKSNLRLKKKQIKLLRENLRKACIVAKTVMTAKENETTSLHNHINSARSECADLTQKNKTSAQIICNLSSENRKLKDKLNNLDTFIHLGYQELQKIRDHPAENIPIAMQLKEIMISCGQYYADYSNEHDTRLKVEQKNRFLSNKLNIIANNLQALVEELKNLRYQNNKLKKENSALKNKYLKQIENIPGCLDDNDFREKNGMEIKNLSLNSSLQTIDVDHSFDLSSHLSLVKNLLNNQDSMLKDLRMLSDKLSIT